MKTMIYVLVGMSGNMDDILEKECKWPCVPNLGDTVLVGGFPSVVSERKFGSQDRITLGLKRIETYTEPEHQRTIKNAILDGWSVITPKETA